MELAIHNIKGKDTGRKAKLSKNIFAIEPNDHAIYLDVKQYLANNRKGLHKAKERAEIKGSTRKIKKQKGTGTARAGSIKTPYLEEVEECLAQDLEVMIKKLIKKLRDLLESQL